MNDQRDHLTAARAEPRSRWPWGLVGMILLVAMVESRLDRHRGLWATPTATGFEWAARAATADPAAADVVCLGDSVLKFGFAPRVFEQATGRRADNWATTGNPPAVALSLLRAHLRSGGKPRAILVDFKPFLLDQGACPEVDAWARIATWDDAFELARVAGDLDSLARFALARSFSSCRDRRALRGWIAGAFAGQPTPDTTSGGVRERNWRVNRGGQLLAPDPRATTVAEFANEPPNLRLDWACQPANAVMIRRFFALAARHQVPVCWVLTPIHPRLQAGRDARGIDARFTRFVAEQSRQAPGQMTVLDARRLGLGPDRFVDATHLDRRGATAFTAALGAWFAGLADGSPQPGWVHLTPVPPALAEAADRDAEDLAASARVIRVEADEAKRVALARSAGVK